MINVAHVQTTGIPGTDVITTSNEYRGYHDIKKSDGFVSFTWYDDPLSPSFKIKECVTIPMWRIIDIVETREDE